MPTKSTKSSVVEPKKTSAAKKIAASKQPAKPKHPKQLDRLQIPGMTMPVPGYDGGIPLWLVSFGLTVQVDKNWYARTGDEITIVRMPDMKKLASKILEPGDELSNTFFFTIDNENLPDGEIRLGYSVHLFGDSVPQYSYPLSVLIKTDLPGGKDNDHFEPGHSELKFTLSTMTVYPPDANRGVIAVIKPYPNMHPDDRIHFMWGGVTIEQQVAGVGEETKILIDHAKLVDAGDSFALLVGFFVVDIVGNASELRSRDLEVLVDLDKSKLDPPAFLTDDPAGYLDLGPLDGEHLEVEFYTSGSVGHRGEMYDIVFRAYPPLGGVVVHRAFVPIERAGVAVTYWLPYSVVRAAAGGKLEASFILRRLNDREDLFSKKTYAQVVGSIVRLEAPYFQDYLDHKVNPIPDSAVIVLPWFEWRKPSDTLTVILRYRKSQLETIVFSESRQVGTTWPAGSPVKRLIYRESLEKFDGYKPELYFVYESALTRARSVDLNESLRQTVEIGTPGR